MFDFERKLWNIVGILSLDVTALNKINELRYISHGFFQLWSRSTQNTSRKAEGQMHHCTSVNILRVYMKFVHPNKTTKTEKVSHFLALVESFDLWTESELVQSCSQSASNWVSLLTRGCCLPALFGGTRGRPQLKLAHRPQASPFSVYGKFSLKVAFKAMSVYISRMAESQ